MSQARVMIAAPASGSGKTLVTCGLLQALVNRGLKVSSFKCGPDYIDPMFHSRVIGARSRNLDSFFADDETLKYLFVRSAEPSDISVIEGVMGFYDGIRSSGTEGSSYDVSQKLQAPVILMVNARGAALSCVPVVKGFKEFRENNIRGIILNNMSEGVYRDVKPVIEKEVGVKVLGFVPKIKGVNLESRHLGLVLPGEIRSLRDDLDKVADVIEKNVDVDAIIEMANSAPEIHGTKPEFDVENRHPRIGFALDDAFCFNYEDNIELLKECGAEIVYFSPLNDARLPDVDGIILSGGYPELHGRRLSENTSMIQDIRDRVSAGMPCLAECGGFMYLNEKVEDSDGNVWPMVGLVHGEVRNRGRLTRFGYVSLASEDPDSMIAGGARGHEFHYWDSTDNGTSWHGVKPSGREYDCGHEEGSLVAGFPHLYYYSNPEMAYRFVKRCADWRSAHQRLRCRRDDGGHRHAEDDRRHLAGVALPVVEGLRQHVDQRHEREDPDGEAQRHPSEAHVDGVQQQVRGQGGHRGHEAESREVGAGPPPPPGHQHGGGQRERHHGLVHAHRDENHYPHVVAGDERRRDREAVEERVDRQPYERGQGGDPVLLLVASVVGAPPDEEVRSQADDEPGEDGAAHVGERAPVVVRGLGGLREQEQEQRPDHDAGAEPDEEVELPFLLRPDEDREVRADRADGEDGEGVEADRDGVVHCSVLVGRLLKRYRRFNNPQSERGQLLIILEPRFINGGSDCDRMSIVSVSLDEESEKGLERIQEAYGVNGRSEAVRLAIRTAVGDLKDAEGLTGTAEGVIVCVRRDHADPWMNVIQERHVRILKSLLHSHLRDSRCLDVMIVSGDADEVVGMVAEIKGAGKADYVRFVANRGRKGDFLHANRGYF